MRYQIKGGYTPTTGFKVHTIPDEQPDDITAAVERTLAENLRLRDWLRTISNIRTENSAEDKLIRRIRYMTRRALQGDKT